MQARMDVLEQQGVVQGNQAPADLENGHQVRAAQHVCNLNWPFDIHNLKILENTMTAPTLEAWYTTGLLNCHRDSTTATQSSLSPFCQAVEGVM